MMEFDLSALIVVTNADGAILAQTLGPEAVDVGRAMIMSVIMKGKVVG